MTKFKVVESTYCESYSGISTGILNTILCPRCNKKSKITWKLLFPNWEWKICTKYPPAYLVREYLDSDMWECWHCKQESKIPTIEEVKSVIPESEWEKNRDKSLTVDQIFEQIEYTKPPDRKI